MRNAIVLLGAVGFSLATCSASGQAAKGSPNPDILAYELTLPRANHLITAMEAMTKYVVSLPDYHERVARSVKLTPAERVAQIEKDPKAAAILKQNQLSARDYLVGIIALRMSLLAAQGVPNASVSPANLAFAKANLAQLKARMDAVDGLSPSK